MLSQAEQQRYTRQIMLPNIGKTGQLKLKAAKVLVIGAGGLGCPVLQYLTAAGVGTIGIVDGDTVSASNLQRQFLFTHSDINQPKATIAQQKLLQQNQHIQIIVHETYINATNALAILKDYDVIVDGSDNFATRYLVNDACVLLQKPMVFGAIFKFEGQVSVFNYENGPTYRCIFPEPTNPIEIPNCTTIGVISTLPGIIGTLQANEVIKIIIGIGQVLSGKLLVLDALSLQVQTFQFAGVAANKNITQLAQPPTVCATTIASISYQNMQAMLAEDTVVLIDVRLPNEHHHYNIGGQNIPLANLNELFNAHPPNKNIVLYCATGHRSQQAVQLLMEKGCKNVWSLEGGLNALTLV
jgi:adenylyltransferase/sulfurtransferase